MDPDLISHIKYILLLLEQIIFSLWALLSILLESVQ